MYVIITVCEDLQSKTHCVSKEPTAGKGNDIGQQRFTAHLLSLAPEGVFQCIQSEGRL